MVLLLCILQPSNYTVFFIRLGTTNRQIGCVLTFCRDVRSKNTVNTDVLGVSEANKTQKNLGIYDVVCTWSEFGRSLTRCTISISN